MAARAGIGLLALMVNLWPCSTANAWAQEPEKPAPDPFAQRIELLELRDETIRNGIARLSTATDIAFSIEHRIRPKGSSPLPPDPAFTVRIENKTVQEVLDWLCNLDPRYTWSRDGNIANIFPRQTVNDRTYLFNRALPVLLLREARDAEGAVFQVAEQAPPNPNLIFFQPGGSLGFSEPWTATFTNITVRQAFNRVAARLGQTHGWQFTGSQDFQFVMFHARLHPRPRPGEKREEPFVRPDE